MGIAQHHVTSVVLQGWATEVEKATSGRVKLQMLPKHPSAPPGTFDAVRDRGHLPRSTWCSVPPVVAAVSSCPMT